MDEFQEVIKEFLVECYESLDQLDSDFVTLEENPNDRDRLASIFRTVHTIKGTSGFLALPKLERVAHVGENLLVPLRDGNLQLTHEMASSLLGMVDAIRSIVSNIEDCGAEGDESYDSLIAELEEMLHSKPQLGDELTEVTENDGDAENDGSSDVESAAEESEEESAEEATADAEVEDGEDCETTVETKTEVVAESSSASKDTPTAKKGQKSEKKPAAEKAGGSLADSSIRVDVGLLDKLMNLVGELVLARNQVLQFSDSSQDASIVAASQRLNLITTELQEGVMKTRMQPIKNAWNKLPRVVRDLSSSCGKSVEVVMEGKDTELDKTILEAIKDPLTHIVRNSVDHGIETSEVRVAKGKPPEGTLKLHAFHEGGQVNIEVSDDGGGINPERIRAKAISKGMLTEAQAADLDERDLINLILLPGFSTAEKVTNVSGRGVGMDVVKTNIEKIGGSLDIQSKFGEGTTLRIKIPLTLAIVPALIVSTGDNQYAIPQVNLLELVRLSGESAKEIELIHDAPVYRLRGKLLPLVYLDEQLELRPPRARHEYAETANIVVLQAEDRSFGLVVDSVTDTQEIVVKPLGQHLKGIQTYAGATIMGDGQVALILDAIGLAQKGNVLSIKRDHVIAENNRMGACSSGETQSLLVVDTGTEMHSAILLSTIARLEEFDVSEIEDSRQGKVMQYRGEIMPLISLQYGMDTSESQRVHIVVFTHGKHNVGVVVSKIVDIVEATGLEQHKEDRIIIQDRIIELLDLEQVVRSQHPEIFETEAQEEAQYV